MIISIGEKVNRECTLNFGTHNGIFHCDDVMAMAILEMAHMENDIHVVRSRNLELNKLDIVVDIGGGMFDHHMAGFNVRRPTGKKYASAGLVWEKFAEKAIRNVANEQGISIDDKTIQLFKEQIDQEIIIPIDFEDNGPDPEDEETEFGEHTFSFVSKFLPTFLEVQDFDTAFINVEHVVFEILKGIVKNKIIQVATKPYLQKRFEEYEKDGILEVSAQTVDWLEEVVKYNEIHDYSIKFVIFPYPAGGWAAQCVPPSISKRMNQLVPFPKEWAGGDEKTLPKISGVQDATFCQNGLFFARAKTKQSIIEMCKIAMS